MTENMEDYKLELCLKIKSLNYKKIELYKNGNKVLTINKNRYIDSKTWGVEVNFKTNTLTFNYDNTVECEFDNYKIID